MRRYDKNLILVSIIISITLLCVYSFNLGNYDLNRRELNQRTYLKLSQLGTELTLNTEFAHQSGHGSYYYITVPKGNVHIKVSWDSFWDFDLALYVYSDPSYSYDSIIATSDNPRNEPEIIDLNIEQEKTIYIQVSGWGAWYSIIVHDDTYAILQIIFPIIIIIIIVVVVLGLIITLKSYIKKRKKEIKTFITAELKPYPAKMEETKSDEDEETNIFICPYCGQENLKSYKKCKYCKKKF